jgi:hypothetical protein
MVAPDGASALPTVASALAPDAVPTAADDAAERRVNTRSVLRVVTRRALPHVFEATLAPAALFYICLIAFGTWVAFVAALWWSYGAIVRRKVLRRGVPPILVLSTVALTVRTLVAIASGSTFIYFFQPVLGTVAMAGVFLGSLAIGRPLVGTLAADFWPMPADVAAHPAVLRLFRVLTVLWACVNLASASVTFVLLLTMPVSHFVPAKTVSGYVITVAGVIATVSLSVATARRHGIVRAATSLSTLASPA